MPLAPRRWFFDAWSRAYDVPWVQRLTYRPVHDAVLRVLRRQHPRAVLDVGCGTGLLLARIGEELPEARVVGCDFSAGMLTQARGRDTGATLVQGDATALPFRDASFEALVSTEAFHWFPDQRAALTEFRRVLVPGGRLLLALVNPRFALAGQLAHLGSRLLGQPFFWPTTGEVRHLVRDAGFRVDRQVPIARLPGALFFPGVLTLATRAPATDDVAVSPPPSSGGARRKRASARRRA